MQNDLSPDYHRSLVPAAVGNTSPYRLCNASNLQTLLANSHLNCNSFLPSAVELPEFTRNSPNNLKRGFLEIRVQHPKLVDLFFVVDLLIHVI